MENYWDDSELMTAHWRVVIDLQLFYVDWEWSHQRRSVRPQADQLMRLLKTTRCFNLCSTVIMKKLPCCAKQGSELNQRSKEPVLNGSSILHREAHCPFPLTTTGLIRGDGQPVEVQGSISKISNVGLSYVVPFWLPKVTASSSATSHKSNHESSHGLPDTKNS